MDLKSKIERILSDVLSQKHDAKVNLRFEKSDRKLHFVHLYTRD